MLRNTLPAMCLFFAATISIPCKAAQPVARVLEVKGDVSAEILTGMVRPVTVFGTIYLDARIVAKPGSLLVLAFRNDGHLERIVGSAEVRATSQGCIPKDKVAIVAPAPRHEQLTTNVAKDLSPITRGGATIVRAPPGEDSSEKKALPVPLSPMLLSTVISNRPDFSWVTGPDKARYELTIFHNDDEIWTAKTTKTKQQYDAEQPLQRGEKYSWIVKQATENTVPEVLCKGSFTVATEQQVEMSLAVEKLSQSDDAASHLLAISWYADKGMLNEALELVEKLSRRCAEEPQYQTMQADLYRRAGREKEADAALQRAEELSKTKTIDSIGEKN